MALHVSTGNYHLTCQTVKSSGLKTGKGGEWKTLKGVGYKIKVFFKKTQPYIIYRRTLNEATFCFALHVSNALWDISHSFSSLKAEAIYPALSCLLLQKSLREGPCCSYQLDSQKDTRAKPRSVSRRKDPGCVQPPSSQGGIQLELK